MNRLRSLTKNQRDAVSDFLVALSRELPPAMMVKLLRKVIIDIQQQSENILVPLRVSWSIHARAQLRERTRHSRS